MLRPVALAIALLVVASGVGGVASDAAASPASDEAAPLAAQRSPQSAGANAPAADRTEKQFEFDLVRTTNCGLTCRDVTIRVTNVGDDPVRDINVATVLKAGDNVVWRGNEAVRRLNPGESRTVTKRVRLGPFDVFRVRQNGGVLTADTTVTWDGGRVTFTERRKVA